MLSTTHDITLVSIDFLYKMFCNDTEEIEDVFKRLLFEIRLCSDVARAVTIFINVNIAPTLVKV